MGRVLDRPAPGPRSARSSADLLHRARQLRSAAEELERRARAESPKAPSGYWSSVVNGDWTVLRQAGERTAPSPSEGRSPSVALRHATTAVLGALHGETAAARASAALAESMSWGDAEVAVGVCLARAVAEFAAGRPTASFEYIRSHLDSPWSAPGARQDVIGVLAEVSVSARQEHYARLALASCSDTSSREAVLARAILAPGVDPLLEAIEPGQGHPPFLLGRLHLALGMRMRRTHHVRGSRAHLQTCVDLLSPLSAGPWIDLARNELRAAGVPQPSETSAHSLTRQELAIARLAAEGLSNRDIGELLHLSPRTVGSHLYKIFPKLGITRRQQIATSLGQSVRPA
jgi:DNA-binding CsgD family transcriptional regulator